MVAFIIRRILWAIPVLFFVALVSFFLMHLAPGGPFDTDNSRKQVDGATLAALNRRFGLDKPQYFNPAAARKLWNDGVRNPFTLGRAYLDSQFFNYIFNAMRGDLGPSYRQRGKSVQDIILKQWPYSMRLGIFALTFAVAVGIPLGVLAALRQNTIFDYASLFLATIGVSVPTFVTGLLVIIFFGTYLQWISITDNDWDTWRPYIAPHCARQGTERAHGDLAPHPAQRVDPGRDGARPGAGRPDRRRGDHRVDLQYSRHRQVLRRLNLPARLLDDYGLDTGLRHAGRAGQHSGRSELWIPGPADQRHRLALEPLRL